MGARRSRKKGAFTTPASLAAFLTAALAVPHAWSQDGPKLPEAPKLPDVKLPDAKLPDAKLPAPPKAPDPKKDAKLPAGGDAKAAEPAKGGDTAAAAPKSGVPEDIDIVLTDEKPKAAQDGVPATLPRELKNNAPAGSKIAVQDRKGNAALTIEEVVNPPIVSASKRKETAQSAPAWALVLSARDLRARGYTELSDMLDDLPGMDVIRPFGDFYFKSYIRGQRSTASDTYLFMIDGVVMNDLFYTTTDMLAAMPMTNIDQVEIVYGPASALYGPNASTGIINVITNKGDAAAAAAEYGLSFNSRIVFGGAQANFSKFDTTTKVVDATALYVQKDYRLRVSARFEDGALDTSVADGFEYTKSSYYGDPRVWNALGLAEAGLSGTFLSRDQKLGVDARVFLGRGTEIGAQMLTMSTGLGTVYPADQVQQLPWNRRELSAHVRHRAELSSRVDSTTLLQLRGSEILPTANLESSGGVNRYEIFDSPSMGVFLSQDFGLSGLESLLLKGDSLLLGWGLQYSHVEFNRGVRGDTILTCRNIEVASGAVADCPTDPPDAFLRGDEVLGTIPRDNVGLYATARYFLTPAQAIHLGGRADLSSEKNELDLSFRGGYTGTFADLVTIKAMYGQAIFEPGGYQTLQHLTTGVLEDERSQTAELNAELKLPFLAVHAGGYLVHVTDPQDTKTVPGNVLESELTTLKSRMVTGLDVGATFLYKPLRVWATYSRILTAEEVAAEGEDARPVGDLAFDKLQGGVTFDWAPLTATVLGRLVGPRTPVATNPTGELPLHGTLDANVTLSDLLVPGLLLGFRVTNILDARYHHPGIWTADSGDTPASVSDAGVYTGSQGSFNSRLPQPGRAFFGTIGLTLDPAKGK